MADARAAGAAATLVPADAFAALAAIARHVRERSAAKVVGITGSTGKTSTKDVLAGLCALPQDRREGGELQQRARRAAHAQPHRSRDAALRGRDRDARLRPDRPACDYVRPDVGVITAVGPEHLELVGGVAGVARAKAELLEALPAGGAAVLPEGEPVLEPFRRDVLDVHFVPPGADVPLREPEMRDDQLDGHDVRFPLRAAHQLQNAVTAP